MRQAPPACSMQSPEPLTRQLHQKHIRAKLQPLFLDLVSQYQARCAARPQPKTLAKATEMTGHVLVHAIFRLLFLMCHFCPAVPAHWLLINDSGTLDGQI